MTGRLPKSIKLRLYAAFDEVNFPSLSNRATVRTQQKQTMRTQAMFQWAKLGLPLIDHYPVSIQITVHQHRSKPQLPSLPRVAVLVWKLGLGFAWSERPFCVALSVRVHRIERSSEEAMEILIERTEI